MSSEVLKTELVKVGQDSLQAVRQSGHGWLLIKAACEVLGIDTQAQQRRLERTPWATGGMITSVGADGRTREMFCLRSDKVAMWLATIDTSRLANDEARAKLVMWQCEAADVLDRWVRGEQGVAEHKTPAALPPGWSMRKLADIMDKVEQLREALDDYPVATVSSAEEVARLAGICRTTFFKALRSYPELRSNKRGGAWLVHRTLLDLERRGIITLPDRSHITGPEMELAITHRETESLTEEELEEVGSESVWQVCECHRIDAIDKAILSAIMTYKGKAGVVAITRALGFRAERNMQERLRALKAAGYLSVQDNGPGRTKVYTVEQRTLLGHTEHCTVNPRAKKKSDKVVSLIDWTGP